MPATTVGRTLALGPLLLSLCLGLMLGACGGDTEVAAGDREPALAAASTETAGLVALPVRGQLTMTESPMDWAIDGDGLFITADERTGQWVYSRYGRFGVRSDGVLVDESGRRLVGRPADAPIGTAGSPVPPLAMTMPPQATQRVSAEFNLDANARIVEDTVRLDVWDHTSYNSATALTIYDAAGRSFALTLFFRRSADLQWDVFADIDSSSLAIPVTRLVFAPNGVLVSGGMTTLSVPATTLASGLSTATLGAISIDFTRATQWAMHFSVWDLAQDGHSAGHLTSAYLEQRGVLRTTYTNGRTRDHWRVMLANFAPTARFVPMGPRAWACTQTSCGTPTIEEPEIYLLGRVVSGALEQ
jgi:flagellar hook protein FlgE